MRAWARALALEAPRALAAIAFRFSGAARLRLPVRLKRRPRLRAARPRCAWIERKLSELDQAKRSWDARFVHEASVLLGPYD